MLLLVGPGLTMLDAFIVRNSGRVRANFRQPASGGCGWDDTPALQNPRNRNSSTTNNSDTRSRRGAGASAAIATEYRKCRTSIPMRMSGSTRLQAFDIMLVWHEHRRNGGIEIPSQHRVAARTPSTGSGGARRRRGGRARSPRRATAAPPAAATPTAPPPAATPTCGRTRLAERRGRAAVAQQLERSDEQKNVAVVRSRQKVITGAIQAKR